MGNESATVDSAKRQRFYVTLLAFFLVALGVGGYVGYWWHVVRERRAMLDQISEVGSYSSHRPLSHSERLPPSPQYLRMLLGDKGIYDIDLRMLGEQAMIEKAKRLFPEAYVPANEDTHFIELCPPVVPPSPKPPPLAH